MNLATSDGPGTRPTSQLRGLLQRSFWLPRHVTTGRAPINDGDVLLWEVGTRTAIVRSVVSVTRCGAPAAIGRFTYVNESAVTARKAGTRSVRRRYLRLTTYPYSHELVQEYITDSLGVLFCVCVCLCGRKLVRQKPSRIEATTTWLTDVEGQRPIKIRTPFNSASMRAYA